MHLEKNLHPAITGEKIHDAIAFMTNHDIFIDFLSAQSVSLTIKTNVVLS